MSDKRKPIPKTQKEISNSLVTPYDAARGNPNDIVPSPKLRANQTTFRGDTTKPFSLGLEEHDEVIMYYINNIIKPTIKSSIAFNKRVK